jgi:hypothetical protein
MIEYDIRKKDDIYHLGWKGCYNQKHVKIKSKGKR